MEPLLAGDPTNLDDYVVRGRMWSSGSLFAYSAEAKGQPAVIICVRHGRTSVDLDSLRVQVERLAQSLQIESQELGVPLMGGGVTSEYGYLAYHNFGQTSLRERIQRGKPLDVTSTLALFESAERLTETFDNPRKFLVTPDTVLTSDQGIQILGIGAFELLENYAIPGSSLALNSLEWFAPETLNEGKWTGASAKFSLAASLFAASAGSPWSAPIVSLSDLFTRSLDPVRLNESGLAPIFPWLNAQPALRTTAEQDSFFDSEITSEFADATSSEAKRVKSRTPIVLVGVVATAMLAGILFIGVNALGGDTEAETTATSSTQSAEPSASSAASSSESPVVAEPAPTYQVRIDYSNEGIPNPTPTDGLEFLFDVCSGDAQWAKPTFQNAVRMQIKQGTTWKNVSVTPKVQKGGRCDTGKLNMTIAHELSLPTGLEAGNGWTTCQAYRVILPETPDFKKTSVPFCAFVKQIT